MIKHLLISAGMAAVLSACSGAPSQPVSAQNDALTHGNVQMQVQVGQTTQADILDSFGAPNVTTIDGSGQEVWSYQRAATVTADHSSQRQTTGRSCSPVPAAAPLPASSRVHA